MPFVIHSQTNNNKKKVDLLQRYFEETGRMAAAYRDLGGRSEGNFLDALNSLQVCGEKALFFLVPSSFW